MIQHLLTQTIEVLFVSSIAFFTAEFIRFAMSRRSISPGQLELDFSAVASEPIEPKAKRVSLLPWESAIVPFVRPQRKQLNLEEFSIRRLKSIASAVKLPKYNVDPKSRLIHRLTTEVERDRLLRAMSAA